MLLFGVGGVLWNIGIETGLWKGTDEMRQLHFQLRFSSESFCHPYAHGVLLASTSSNLVVPSDCQVMTNLCM